MFTIAASCVVPVWSSPLLNLFADLPFLGETHRRIGLVPANSTKAPRPRSLSVKCWFQHSDIRRSPRSFQLDWHPFEGAFSGVSVSVDRNCRIPGHKLPG